MLISPAASAEQLTISDLKAAFKNHHAKVGIIGLGYVGVPLALSASQAGFKVLGFDIDSERVAQINSGQSFIRHIPSEVISAAVTREQLEATCDFSRLDEP